MKTTLKYSRREAHEVCFGGVKIGGGNPITVQSMTNTPTADVELSDLDTVLDFIKQVISMMDNMLSASRFA